MKKIHFNFFSLALFFVIIEVFSSCEKPSFSSVTGKWEFMVYIDYWVLNPEDADETEDNILCYRDSCYYWRISEKFLYNGFIKKSEEKNVYDIHFLDGKTERVRIEQWPEADYLVILPEHKVVNDPRVNVIYKNDHKTKLNLYIGYGVRELDDIAFIPESGADTIVSVHICGTK